MATKLTDEEFGNLYGILTKSAREKMSAFLYLLWPQQPDQPYIVGRLHEYLAMLVDSVMSGEGGDRQAVSVPPQHGKSRMLAVRTVAWLIGHRPGIQIAMTGFSRELLTTFLREVRTVMDLPSYKDVFPGIYAVKGVDRGDEVEFCNGSAVICKSSGSKLTGRRVDFLIVDDAHAGRAEAESPTQRKRVIEWFFADCVTRLSEGAKVFLIGTRWHPNDLIGHLTSESYVQGLTDLGQDHLTFRVTNITAIADGSGTDPLGRDEGEALFPETRPLSFLLGVKATLPSYEWTSQYDGTPRAASSGQADLTRLRHITLSELPEGVTLTRGWDLAITEKQSADFTAGALCGWDGHNLYIVDIFKRQWAWAKVRRQLIQQAHDDRDTHGVLRMAVEGVGGFDAIYQDVRDELLGVIRVTKRNPGKGGKLLRAQPWLNLIEGGRVFIIRGPWNKDFLEELETFPEGIHDDQCDAVSIAYEELVKPVKNLLIA